MEVKLKSGKKLKIKDITLDDRDTLLDSIEYDYNDEGGIRAVRMMHSTMTKWFRACLVDCKDEIIMSFTLEDSTELFSKLQSTFFVGEEKASK